jgi:geranylgeranyl diphosphate synthase, type II
LNLDHVDRLSLVPPGERILLLPHCLRHSNMCKASYDREGLQCAGCSVDCAINALGDAARRLGYKGVCVAPGGRLAVNYVSETRPAAIVAVACQKELDEGVGNVNSISATDYRPLMVVIPLVHDGCVDTEVDMELALRVLSAGCPESPAGNR